MPPARRQHDVTRERTHGFVLVPVDSVQARLRKWGQSMRLVEASRLVAELDQMVTGVAGGDHKTAAAFGGDEHLVKLMLKWSN